MIGQSQKIIVIKGIIKPNVHLRNPNRLGGQTNHGLSMQLGGVSGRGVGSGEGPNNNSGR